MVRKAVTSVVEIDTLQTTKLVKFGGGISSVWWECLMKAQFVPAGNSSPQMGYLNELPRLSPRLNKATCGKRLHRMKSCEPCHYPRASRPNKRETQAAQ